MRGFTFVFASLFVICLASNESPTEQCHPASCIAADKCNAPRTPTLSCPIEGEVCCSLVRDEDKHRCAHFLGECLKNCHEQLQVLRADDCKEGTKCCILV